MSDGAADQSSEERPTGFPWPPLLLAAVIASALLLGRIWPIAWPGVDDLAARIVGWGALLGGLALALWAAMTLRAARTTVLPHRAATRLVTSGPFRFRRNPIYLAEMLILLGLSEPTKNIWFAILTPLFALLITWLAIVPEERHLEARFGQSYRDYKERTRRLL
jgi:protein-S-isoprenylcysteine O-methyltransferase Ste14